MEWLAAVCHAKKRRGRERATGGKLGDAKAKQAREGLVRERESGWMDGWDAGSRRDSPGYGWLGGVVDRRRVEE
jgi:hypothetical protein